LQQEQAGIILDKYVLWHCLVESGQPASQFPLASGEMPSSIKILQNHDNWFCPAG
jgi:hypothetical protein